MINVDFGSTTLGDRSTTFDDAGIILDTALYY